MNKYNLVIIEGKQCIPFLNLTEKEFYDKLWEWTYEDDLWDCLNENNLNDEELENAIDQFIRENMFHEYEDDDIVCFAFINTDKGIVEYQINDELLRFVYNKIEEYSKRV